MRESLSFYLSFQLYFGQRLTPVLMIIMMKSMIMLTTMMMMVMMITMMFIIISTVAVPLKGKTVSIVNLIQGLVLQRVALVELAAVVYQSLAPSPAQYNLEALQAIP